MAWTHFDLSVLPEDVRRRLLDAIAGAWSALGRRYAVDDGELRVDWGAPVHHTAIPAVVALDTILDPAAAARFHAGVRLTRAFDRIPAMDGAQKRLLAAIGGVDLEDVSSVGLTRRFNGHLFALLERPGLAPFFAVRSPCLDRYDVHPVEPLTLARRARALDAIDRLLLVTICGVYNSDLAADAFRRGWNPSAVDACVRINALRDRHPGIVAHWYGLLAAYPGW